MKYKPLRKTKILEIDDNLTINFLSSNGIFSSSEIASLYINEKLSINVSELENHIVLNIINLNQTHSSLILRINYDILIDISSNSFTFAKANKNYVLNSDHCVFEIDNEGILTLRISSEAESINLHYYEDLHGNIIPLSLTVPEDDYLPEFSIGTFDDSLFTIPRQIRHGIPIISTVPSFTNSASSSADIDAYISGKGKDKRTIYFRIICNRILETTLSPNDLSTLQLKIYLPGGLDTVRPALYIPMYFVQKITSENLSIYRASFDFIKQGFYNGVEYVDGFMYFDVYIPSTIQDSLGLQFDFQFP